MALEVSAIQEIQSACCPICGASSRHLFAKHAISVRECRACRHRYADLAVDRQHVSLIYGDDYFKGGGAGYADYLADRPLRVAQGRRHARRLVPFTVPGTMLDVGSAAGFTLAGFIEAGWKGEGIEPNDRMARAARESGLVVHTMQLNEYSTDELFDLVTVVQVLPHLANPLDAVRRIQQWLRPGGLCFVETWDRASVMARCCGSHWHEYSPPSVLHWFDQRGLDQLFQQCGFHRKASGRMVKWISAGHAVSLLNHTLANRWPLHLVTSMLRLIPRGLSLPYPADDLMWAIYEQVPE